MQILLKTSFKFDNPNNLKFKDIPVFQMHFDVLNTKIKVIIFLKKFTFIKHILSLKSYLIKE